MGRDALIEELKEISDRLFEYGYHGIALRVEEIAEGLEKEDGKE